MYVIPLTFSVLFGKKTTISFMRKDIKISGIETIKFPAE